MAAWNAQANEIFLKALETADCGERQVWLEQACDGDSELRQAVEALLAAHENAGSFLESPALTPGSDETLTKQAETPVDWSALVLGLLDPSENPQRLGRLAHYDVIEVVGNGGMGVVLKAEDAPLNRIVAVKALAPHLASNAAARQRFLREARAAAAVTHPHVVTVHAVDENQRLPFLVMEYVTGESLHQKLERDGPLPLLEILRIGAQIASGLAAAHASGLIHRDIKPSNILLENGVQRVKITDFGLARAVDDVNITRTGDIAGTPPYMSPEQARGELVDCRSDLFSLGCVLYAMCTGRSPFRAESTLAAMRRVCDDAPRPIGEVNPDIPEWLVAIIDRLLAKRREDRFQTAEEVADLLQDCLAHVQHPSAMPLPSFSRLVPLHAQADVAPRPRESRSRWRLRAAAAVVAIVALLGVGLADATGVTEVVPTVIRIVRGEGTLVVEVDDPSVRVSLDGEELSIRGAGFQELRLLPGQYRFRAAKDGQPVKDELVTITRGGRKVMTVTLEPALQPQLAAKAEPGAFVLLGGEGVAERRFDTLEEAVLRSSAGDTIEIRGNGPFISDGVTVRHPLVIRAGEGYTPSLVSSEASADTNIPLLTLYASLTLEGLELRRIGGANEEITTDTESGRSSGHPILIWGLEGESLQVANCRIVVKQRKAALILTDAPVCAVRNCEFSSDAGNAIVWICSSGGRATVENCVSAVSGLMGIHVVTPELQDVAVQVRRNTTVGNCLGLALRTIPESTDRPDTLPPIRLDFSENITSCPPTFGRRGILRFSQLDLTPFLTALDAEALLPRLVELHEQGNVYLTGTRMLRLATGSANGLRRLAPTRGQDLADWDGLFHQKNTGSHEGDVRLKGGDLIHRIWFAGDELTAEDFRLRPDSAGYRAGPDGKDLGADVDLVGPGPAYERWKKTPEYQEWLKETGQQPPDDESVAQTEPGAFALLGGEGVAERRFETLEEAVLRSSGGDTIEVRGNGPFVSDGVTIRHPLVIRAGEGFAPSIAVSEASAEQNNPLLIAFASLVLEGLELRRTGGASGHVERGADVQTYTPEHPLLLWAPDSGSIHVANCRLVFNTRLGKVIYAGAPVCNIRNSTFSTDADRVIDWGCASGGRFTIENCVSAVGGLVVINPEAPDFKDVAIQVRRNTTVGNCLLVVLRHRRNLPQGRDAAPPIDLDFSGNVMRCPPTFGRRGVLCIKQLEPIVPLSEIEELLPRLVGLREQQNVYATDTGMLRHYVIDGDELTRVAGTRGHDLAGWNELWGLENTGSVTGSLRFEGGDLIHRVWSAGEELTAEDFRLRPDSAGYRAGPDGKDLGADIDLVGPGAAYERWKKTPEYQDWLTETGQRKDEPPGDADSASSAHGGRELAVLEKKIAAWRKIIEEKSDDPTAQREVAEAYYTIGVQHTHFGRLEDAERALRKAIELYSPVVSQNRRHLQTRAFEVHLHRALAFARTGPVSLDTMRAALRLAQKLSNDFPGEELAVRNEMDTSLYLLALLGDTPESRALLERSRELADSLDRGTWRPRIDFWEGRFLHNDERYDDAIAAYGRAIELHENNIAEIGAELRQSQYERELLGVALHHQGISLAASGRMDEAVAAQRRSIETLQPLVDAFPHVRPYRRKLEASYRELADRLKQLGGHDEEARQLRDQADRLEAGAGSR